MSHDLLLSACSVALAAAVVWSEPDWRERANRTRSSNLRRLELAATVYASGAGAFRDLLAWRRALCEQVGCPGCDWRTPPHAEPGPPPSRWLRRRVADHVVRLRPPW